MLTYKAEDGNYYMSYVATKKDWQRIGEIEKLEKELQLDAMKLLLEEKKRRLEDEQKKERGKQND